MTYPAALCVILVFFSGLSAGLATCFYLVRAIPSYPFKDQYSIMQSFFRKKELKRAYKAVMWEDCMFMGHDEPACPLCERPLRGPIVVDVSERGLDQ